MILSFDKISKNDAGKAGGKWASLGEMTQAGIAIPPGFVVLAETFENFIDSNNLRAEIQTILGKLDHNNVGSIEHASEEIQELIRGGIISEKIQKEIQKYTKTIKTDFVAVRSSATAEDWAEHAWAWQLDTYLNVPKTDIITKIQSCWASLFTPRALFYRSEKWLGDIHISVAVVVQSMVDAESAGVAFSVHPVTENTDEIVIEWSWWLGEAVVSGEVTPDSFVISKSSWEIISEHIAEKKKGIFRNTNGENEWRDIENRVQEKPILTKKELSVLSQLIIKIENHYGFPCDIEWAYADGKIYILQARPITTLSRDFSFYEKISIPGGIRTFTWEPWLERLWGAFMLSFSEQSFTPTNIQRAWFESLSMEAMLFQEGMWYYSQEVFDSMDADLERYFVSHSIFDLTLSLSHFMYQSEMRIKQLIVSNTSLHQKFEEVYNIMSVAMTFIWITHSIESYYNKKLQIEVPKYITTDIDTFIGDASFPIKPNLHMMLDDMIRDGKTNQEIVDKAGWVKVRDGFSAPYTVQEIDEMRRHISPLQNNKKITIPEPLKALFEQIQELVFFRTERTDVFYYLFFLARPIVEQMGFQYWISFQEMKYYRATSFLDGVPEKYSDKVSFWYFHWESIFQEMPILIEPSWNTLDDGTPIRWVTAYRGKIQWKVKIVTHTSQLDKVNVGDILVTQMTFPSFISAMHRASAFVTDEGGITCHAAIIARELKKPCIIGTKNATKILKDGDLVEVDAENGVVKILSRSKYSLEGKQFLSEWWRACYLYPNRIFCTRAKIPHPLWENDITVISTSENHKVNWYFAVQDESEFDYTLERVLAKNSMLQEGEKEINKVVEKAKRTFKKEYKNRQDAWNGYRNFIKIYEEIWIVPTFMRQLDRAVVRSLHQSKLSEEDFAIATYPTKRTYQRQEEVLILELRTKFEDKITVEIEKKIDEIYKQYYTASLGYFEETVKAKKDYYDMLLWFPKSQAENHLKKIIREEKEMQEKKIKLKKSFPGKASVIDIAGFIVYLKDHYKFQVNKVQHYAEWLFKSISNLTGYDEGLIRDMTPEEIHDLLLKNKINKEEIDKRIAYHAYICNHQNESQLVIGEEAKKFSKRYLATNNKQNCFSGRIACKWRWVGKAKIILGTRDFSKMEEGDILVVMNTSPDFVPIMRKAAAIVAEEWGITGHVSVVSREFGIPSVVGIKQVTSIIDDGDLVEVDAENGVVKILERKENISWAFTYDRQMSYQRINLFHYGYCERLSQYFDVKIENELYRIKDWLVSVFYDEPWHKKAFEKIRNLLTGEERAEWYKKIYKTITQDYREFISFLDKGERKHLKNKPSHTLREYMKHNRKISLSTWLLYSYIEEILSDVFQEIIQQKWIRNWKEIFHTLSQPDQMLPSDEWEYDVVQTAILAKEKQLGRIEKLALKYRSYWMYDVMFHGKSQKDIEKKVKETTQESAKQILKNIEKKYKQQKKELEKIKNIKWNKDEKSLLKLYRLYANFKDWKNFHRERSSYQIWEVYSEIAEKYPLLEEEMLYYMREDEILTGIEKNKWPSKKDILRRKENSALLFLRNREENITDISKLEELDKQTSIHKNSITGVTAYPWKVTGKAHIINSHKDLKKLKKWEIMISSTTRPDYLPFMQDIWGFITNEGGVLSHAAILAREIKKPCIIGTKVATQAIKTGDIICLDGERGIVDLLS